MLLNSSNLPRRQVRHYMLALLVVTCITGVPADAAVPETVDGFLEPYRRAHLASPETGIVSQVFVEEGDVVRKGDVLATLDDEVYAAGLAVARHEANAKAQLATARAQLEMRRHRLGKLQELLQSGHAQPEEVVRAQTDLAIAEAALLSAQEHLELKRLECQQIEAQISRRRIVAPLDGYVTTIHKREGEVVSPADPHVLTLTKLDLLQATFLVDLTHSRRLQKGQEVTIQVMGREQAVRGTVECVSAVADAKSGTIEVRIRVPNANAALLSGERCTLYLP